MSALSEPPAAYAAGETTFRGLRIRVDPRVFVPRPETELLVEAALDIPERLRVLEPCTGSGAVAISLSHERPDLRIAASDRSPDALAVARVNAHAHAAPLTLYEAEGITAVPGGPYRAVVANPPYVAVAERGTGSLPPSLEFHEPGGAFWAGEDGLDAYRALTLELDEAAWVAFEVGDGQAEPVWAMLVEVGFEPAGYKRAPSGQIRVVVAER